MAPPSCVWILEGTEDGGKAPGSIRESTAGAASLVSLKMNGCMKSVQEINISPVKSLGLSSVGVVHIGMSGIVEDRRLFLIDNRDRLVTQREVGRLTQVKADYRGDSDRLCLDIPGSDSMEGSLEAGAPVAAKLWGRDVTGDVVPGDWGDALSDFCGQAVRLVLSSAPGQCYDEYPISLLSQASLDALNREIPVGQVDALDARRFRPNFLISGCDPHEEDSWLGQTIRVGDEMLLHVVARDPRCVITCLDPDTGEADFDTRESIARYRPRTGPVYFGVYGIVERAGSVSVGDQVKTPINASS